MSEDDPTTPRRNADAVFREAKREIAARNEAAQKAARDRRAAFDRLRGYRRDSEEPPPPPQRRSRGAA